MCVEENKNCSQVIEGKNRGIKSKRQKWREEEEQSSKWELGTTFIMHVWSERKI